VGTQAGVNGQANGDGMVGNGAGANAQAQGDGAGNGDSPRVAVPLEPSAGGESVGP
jgi:hypothetical protein